MSWGFGSSYGGLILSSIGTSMSDGTLIDRVETSEPKVSPHLLPLDLDYKRRFGLRVPGLGFTSSFDPFLTKRPFTSTVPLDRIEFVTNLAYFFLERLLTQ